jgi:hypothetical protein
MVVATNRDCGIPSLSVLIEESAGISRRTY